MTFENGLLLWELIHKFADSFAWPILVLVLVLLFRGRVGDLIDRIKSADLPGGLGLTFEREAKRAAQKAIAAEKLEGGEKTPSTPKKERGHLNSFLTRRALTPLTSNFDEDHYFDLSDTDPKLALAAVRIDLEAMINNLAALYDIDFAKELGARRLRALGLGMRAQILLKREIVTPSQMATFQDILPLANKAIHGLQPSREAANSIIEAFLTLLDDFAVIVERFIANEDPRAS